MNSFEVNSYVAGLTLAMVLENFLRMFGQIVLGE